MLKDLARRAAKVIVKEAEKKLDTVIEPEDTSSPGLIKKYSKARLLLPLTAVEANAIREDKRTAPKPTGIAIRTRDEEPIMFFNDGSVRNLNTRKTRLANRKAARKARARVIDAARRGEETAKV